MDERNEMSAARGEPDGPIAGEVRIGAHSGRALQIARVRAGGWTQERRQKFLDTLAETCNVTRAAAAAGMRVRRAYQLRDADPVFAGLWQAALALGYERLETALLRHALVGVNALEIGRAGESADTTDEPAEAAEETEVRASDRRGDIPGSGILSGSPTPVQMQLALAVLNRRDAAERRGGVPRGLRRATLAEAEAALTERLDMLARTLARSGAPPMGRRRGSDPA